MIDCQRTGQIRYSSGMRADLRTEMPIDNLRIGTAGSRRLQPIPNWYFKLKI